MGKKSYTVFGFVLSKSEKEKVAEKAKANNLKMSKYIRLCMYKAMEQKSLIDYSKIAFDIDVKREDKKQVMISIPQDEENKVKEIKKYLEERNIKFCSYIRYCSLNIDIDDEDIMKSILIDFFKK